MLEPVVDGLVVGGVTGVVASNGICCTSKVRLGVAVLEGGVAGLFGSVGVGVTGVVMVGSTVATESLGVCVT